jgi:hypothetical protein
VQQQNHSEKKTSAFRWSDVGYHFFTLLMPMFFLVCGSQIDLIVFLSNILTHYIIFSEKIIIVTIALSLVSKIEGTTFTQNLSTVITCCLAKVFLENRLTPSKEIKKHVGPRTFAS